MCGCGSGNTCKYCNSDYFFGYDRQQSKSLSYSFSAPNTNGNTCSANTQYVDVNLNVPIYKVMQYLNTFLF